MPVALTGAAGASAGAADGGLGRLVSVDNLGTPDSPHVSLVAGYDANGNRTSLIATIDGVQDFRNQYTYDDLNRLTGEMQFGQAGNLVSEKRVDFTYDLDGQWDTMTRYASLDTSQFVATSLYAYDADGRLTGLTHSDAGTTLAGYAWTYDKANRVTTLTNSAHSDENATYSYDNAGQLTAATGTTDESYAYDNNGNRTVANGVTNTVGTDNRLTSDGTYSYTYDDEGNMISRTEIAHTGNVRIFAYDYRNRLVEVKDYTDYVDASDPGTLVMHAEYTYDVNNLRIAKSVDDGVGDDAAVITRFIYDGSNVVLQFNGTTLSHRYLNGPQIDQIMADEALGETPNTIWALTDNLGSVRDLVDYTGALIDHIVYNSFGLVTSESETTTHFLFGYTGAVYDRETGLQYHNARYYDPTLGRWISQDPIGFNAGDQNLYRYVGNTPLDHVDPWGQARLTVNGFPILARENLDVAVHIGDDARIPPDEQTNQWGQPARFATGSFSFTGNTATSYVKLFGKGAVCNTISGSLNDEGGAMLFALDNRKPLFGPAPYALGLYQISVDLNVIAILRGCGQQSRATGRFSSTPISVNAMSIPGLPPRTYFEAAGGRFTLTQWVGREGTVNFMSYLTDMAKTNFYRPGTVELWGSAKFTRIARIGN